jgi:hypothetical protein
MIKLGELFEVRYGVNLELNRCKIVTNGINFVSRTEKNNGVSAIVELIDDVTPIPEGVLTVAGGGSVLETFLQPAPFYSGRDLYYLVPLIELTTAQKLYYCTCIRANKYRFSYGRQANKTLREIKIPVVHEIPSWVNSFNVDMFAGIEKSAINSPTPKLDTSQCKAFEYQELFNIDRGTGPRKKDLGATGTTPFITSTDANNGLSGFTSCEPTHKGNTISVNRNGSVAEAFFQPAQFCSTEDVHIFTPKFPLTPAIGLFLATLIRKEKYRFGYGRKWGIQRMKTSIIKLPVTAEGTPDWQFMENYIKTLPYSSEL